MSTSQEILLINNSGNKLQIYQQCYNEFLSMVLQIAYSRIDPATSWHIVLLFSFDNDGWR